MGKLGLGLTLALLVSCSVRPVDEIDASGTAGTTGQGGSGTAGTTGQGGSASAGTTGQGGSATAGTTGQGGSAAAGTTGQGGSATAGTTGRGGSAAAGTTGRGGSAAAGTTGQGGSAVAGTTGQGGSAGGTSGRGGAGGRGGGGGQSCAELQNAYSKALRDARACNASLSTPQCQHKVASSLACGCETFVNDPTELAAIQARWVEAKCDQMAVICPAVACRALTKAACVPISSGDFCMDTTPTPTPFTTN